MLRLVLHHQANEAGLISEQKPVDRTNECVCAWGAEDRVSLSEPGCLRNA